MPIYNEAENIALLHEQIVIACRSLKKKFEIIFIDDGSLDNSLEIMKRLSPVKIICFRKNFGQTAALDAGFKAAEGEFIVAMDGDLQNDPADIPLLLERLVNDEYDVVSGWRKNRQDNCVKRWVSKGAHFLRRMLINDGIHDSGCTLKIYRRECFQSIDLYGEMHRFIPAVLKLKGFKVGEQVVNHRPRINGLSKYGFSRTIKGFLDMLSVWFWKKFANRPLHLFGAFGLFLFSVALIASCYAIYLKVVYHNDLSDTLLSSLAMMSFLMGAQFLVFGLLADLLSKNYYSITKDSPYTIKEIIVRED